MIKRNTIQRRLILDAVRRLKSHPTADEVYNEIIKEYPSISRTTVYRGLHELDEAGEIALRRFPNSPDHYDHNCTDHYHLQCAICGKIVDLDMDYIPNLHKNIQDNHGFQITGHAIIFQGICPDCAKKEVK